MDDESRGFSVVGINRTGLTAFTPNDHGSGAHRSPPVSAYQCHRAIASLTLWSSTANPRSWVAATINSLDALPVPAQYFFNTDGGQATYHLSSLWHSHSRRPCSLISGIAPEGWPWWMNGASTTTVS